MRAGLVACGRHGALEMPHASQPCMCMHFGRVLSVVITAAVVVRVLEHNWDSCSLLSQRNEVRGD